MIYMLVCHRLKSTLNAEYMGCGLVPAEIFNHGDHWLCTLCIRRERCGEKDGLCKPIRFELMVFGV